jgi:hypothetical protein
MEAELNIIQRIKKAARGLRMYDKGRKGEHQAREATRMGDELEKSELAKKKKKDDGMIIELTPCLFKSVSKTRLASGNSFWGIG